MKMKSRVLSSASVESILPLTEEMRSLAPVTTSNRSVFHSRCADISWSTPDTCGVGAGSLQLSKNTSSECYYVINWLFSVCADSSNGHYHELDLCGHSICSICEIYAQECYYAISFIGRGLGSNNDLLKQNPLFFCPPDSVALSVTPPVLSPNSNTSVK